MLCMSKLVFHACTSARMHRRMHRLVDSGWESISDSIHMVYASKSYIWKKTFSTFSIRHCINVPQFKYMSIAVTFPNRILLSTTCSSLLAMATFLSIRSRWQLRPPSNNCTRSEVCGYRHHVPRGYEWSWLSMETRPFYSLPQTQDQQGGGSRMGYTTESRLELLTIIQTNHGQYKSVVFTLKLTIQWK